MAGSPIHPFAGKIAGTFILEKLMKKLLLLLLMLLSVSLSGCLQQSQATPTLLPTSPATDTAKAGPAPTVVLTVPGQSALFPDSGCTVITRKPTPGPTAESIYPPVTDADHAKGPASAKVTIIEYSDFQ